MASFKNDPAITHDAGDTFNYQVWTADTELALCNVPWDAGYKDVVHFDTTDDLNTYLDATADIRHITNASYARIDEPVSIDIPIGLAQQYNYIRAYNPAQPVPGNDVAKYYYYFIVGIIHDSPNSTRLIVQLDVWQTYIRLIQFGRAYIDSGHIGVANENKSRNHGRDFLTVPDGLDTGSDYVNVAVKRYYMLPTSATPNFNVVVFSSVDLNAPPYLDPPTNKTPNNPTARPTLFNGIPTGAAGFVFKTPGAFMSFMAKYSQYPWMTAGIMSITLVPDLAKLGYTFSAPDPDTGASQLTGAGPATARYLFPNWRTSTDITGYIPARYSNVMAKFLTSPYCMIELTANAGNAIVLKPELWNSESAQVIETSSFLPPNQRVVYYPANYNGRNAASLADGQRTDPVDPVLLDGDQLDIALIISQFPTVPIVNNAQIQYLASNAHSIQAQYQAMEWSQNKSLRGNEVAAQNTTTGINASFAQTQNSLAGQQGQLAIQQDLASRQALMGLFTGAAGGAAGGAAAGLPGMGIGAATGVANGLAGAASLGMQQNAQNQSMAQTGATAWGATKIGANAAANIRDTNKAFADFAAQGDYGNARRLMDGRIQDTRMLPQSVAGGFGGDAYLFSTRQMILTAKFKMPDQASIARVGEHWLRYGYPVNRPSLIPNDLRVMTNFSYWKLTECYIVSGTMPEDKKQTIRGILQNGVTVWTNASDIGVLDYADNDPLPGITLDGYEPPAWTPDPVPEPPATIRKRQRNMIVYTTVDGTSKWALAGSAGSGVAANYIITDDSVLAANWMNAINQDTAVPLDVTTFYQYETDYTAQVSVLANAVRPFYTVTDPVTYP